ncbi:Mur ligase family protein [Waddlia chondrophila]|uniref:Putative UDP-N-acetylmuramate--L-alanine ligase n=1 Tax=Waddlia chondrophila (strain ATCC VR-1470 / WSU 86-1044) TaxID=716544 RepID=D6YWZ0_WADCW|nr:UDP-N-acetylmuramoyl-tripeptide--D-alanyl-D-alanine ligase [Waddlia chondrophila]ADI38651.1 putative UDP-N-acetylmuramate--L-alanine ligase [Waddlia chondrophila WSU 86-1044]
MNLSLYSNLTSIPSFWLFFISCLLFSTKRLFRYLRFLQQDAYLPKRFVEWLWKEQAYDKKGTAIALLSAILPSKWSLEVCAFLLLLITFLENNPLREGKLKLQLTPRAKRIAAIAFILYLPLQILSAFYLASFFGQLLIFQSLPFLLIASLYLLSYDESRRQKILIKGAKQKLKKIDPYVIGITGSYGKTSTKDALGQLLQITLGSTFWPSKGINTDMGITRSIRERLEPLTKYAVIEMAAYGTGSIRRLCGLTPPHAGIITGIGLAHLDRFGDQKTIYQAKSELAQAIPEEGILICNGDNPGTRQISAEFKKQTTLLYGLDNSKRDLDCWITPLELTKEGTRFRIEWEGKSFEGITSLYGNTSLSNCAGAFAMACALGAQPDFAAAALSTLIPVNNRLQISRDEERTYIHDAYNSNPEGFLSALHVLHQMPARKRILMTPGMIELAEQNLNMHHKVGYQAAKVCDLAILVGKTNRESLSLGLIAGGFTQSQIITAEHRSEAFEKLAAVMEKGDAVLIENDLPDLYEHKESF